MDGSTNRIVSKTICKAIISKTSGSGRLPKKYRGRSSGARSRGYAHARKYSVPVSQSVRRERDPRTKPPVQDQTISAKP
jgi:hypothetical protein